MKKSLDYILWISYTVCLYFVWKLCQNGGVSFWLKRILPMAIICGIILLVRFIYYRQGLEIDHIKTKLSLFCISTIFFLAMVIQSAIPYRGALSWKIDEWINHKTIPLTHSNLFQDGIEGILQDINRSVTLPKDLYISETLDVQFKGDGTITKVETMLYGRDNQGNPKGYLVNYDAKKTKNIELRLNHGEGFHFISDKKLEPLFVLFKNSKYKDHIDHWNLLRPNSTFGLSYSGKQEVFDTQKLYLVPREGLETSYFSKNPNAIPTGYQTGFYRIDEGKTILFRCLVDAETSSLESPDQITNQEKWSINESNGTIFTFLNPTLGYRLVVKDAAAGSRFYVLEKTIDAGASWEEINPNPFLDTIGSAIGIEFVNQEIGFIGIQGASGSHSSLFLTRDGGKTFHLVELPFSLVQELPKSGQENGWTLEKYQYLSMPKLGEKEWTTQVTVDAFEKDGIEFYSLDQGKTWQVRK